MLPQKLLKAILDRNYVELLISPDSWLGLVPWAALIVSDDGTRLVEHALITITPILTCLSLRKSPLVSGPSLIRLVGPDENGVDVHRERIAWGLSPNAKDGVLVGGSGGSSPPVPIGGRLTDVLREGGSWQFLHVAAHGGGAGLEQYLAIPGEHISAATVLGLKWPASVLMASCHVGMSSNPTSSQRFDLVTALLASGAHCVVACIDSVDDQGTAAAASHIVREIRARGVPLDVAMREAQLTALRAGAPEVEWALLTAYVR
jgi:hypothetical protein